MPRVDVLAVHRAVEECFVIVLLRLLPALLRRVRSLKPLTDRLRCQQHVS